MSDKTKLILNSSLELGFEENDGKGKGKYFRSRFIEPGVAHYNELGDILITKETLNKFIDTMVGCPVIIDHKDVTDKNVNKLRVGVVSKVWFNEYDGYFYCEGILTDPEAIDLVKNQGWNVSCAYSFVSDNTKRLHNGKEIDMEFTDGEFLHLALVQDPRYEGANIVVNSLVENAKDWDGNEGDWITVKGNHLFVKKGQSKDEAVKEFLEDKKSESKDKSGDSKEKEVKTKEEKIKYINDKAGSNIDLSDSYSSKDIDKLYKHVKEGGKIHKINYEWVPKQATHFDENGKILSKKQYHYDSMDGMFDKIDRDFVSKDKSGDGGEKPNIEKFKFANKGNPEGPISYKGEKRCGDYKDTYKYVIERTERIFENAKKERNPLQSFEANIRNLNGNYAIRDVLRDKGEQYHKVTQEINKYQDSFREKLKQANNNIGDITMSVLNDLKDFIMNTVKNEKEDEMKVKNEDKRKLIDEVGGILKGKVDDKIIRTIMKKMEEASYEPSEDGKADNEEDEKEAKNKCKNEEEKIEEKEEKVTENEDEEEDDKEEKAENKKVKNSMKDLVMGGNSSVEEQKLFISRKERLEEGNKY